MKDLMKLLLFIVYTSLIFLMRDYYVIALCALFNLILLISLRVNVKRSLKFLFSLLPFILFVVLINLLFNSVNNTILIGCRLLLVCNITYTFKCLISTLMLCNAIETLLFPFKKLSKDISLILCISITFIPILINEFKQIKYALRAKGMIISIKTFKYLLIPFLYGIFKRTNEVSLALIAKGYVD